MEYVQRYVQFSIGILSNSLEAKLTRKFATQLKDPMLRESLEHH